MDEIHRKILRENRSYLVKEIEDVEGISDILIEKGVLTESMNQDILSNEWVRGGMDEIHRKILRENRSYLVKEIEDVEGISDILIEKGVLTESMNQDILAEKTKIGRTRKLLDTLPKRGQYAFDIFCNTLIRTSQRHIAENLNPGLIGSGVTAVPAEPVPGTNKTEGIKSTTSPQAVKTKQNNSKPSLPVPVQVPIINSNPKTSGLPGSNKGSSLPNPVYPTDGSGTRAGSQPSTPNDEKYQPTFGRQESREATPYEPSDEELLCRFPKPESDWPNRLDMKFGSSVFEVQNCAEEELNQQLKNRNTYPSDKTKRALIINNLTFDDEKYEERKFADMDSFRIQQVLKKLDFQIRISTNVKKESLLELLSKEREQDGYELCVFVLVVMSYGGAGTILCTDGEFLPVRDILNLFSSKNCPLMAGVPKLFLLQACGTIMKDFPDISGEDSSKDNSVQCINAGIEELNLGAQGGGETVTDTRGSLHTSESETSLSDQLATEDDMLVALATSADEKHEQNQYRSLFMLSLSYIISNFAKSDHFITLLKGVNRMKKSNISGDAVKLCEFKHSFTKKLYLLPGYSPYKAGGAGDSLPSSKLGSTRPT